MDKKPIRWDYFEEEERKQLYLHIADLTRLRDSLNLGTVDRIDYSLSGSLKVIEIEKGSNTLLAIGNFGVTSQSLVVDFPSDGMWYDLYSSDSLDYAGSPVTFSLEPGEYRLYANQDFGCIYFVNTLLDESAVSVFPNPTKGLINIVPTIDLQIESISLFDAAGRRMLFSEEQSSDYQMNSTRQDQLLDVRYLPKGVYFLHLKTSAGIAVKKVVKAN